MIYFYKAAFCAFNLLLILNNKLYKPIISPTQQNTDYSEEIGFKFSMSENRRPFPNLNLNSNFKKCIFS